MKFLKRIFNFYLDASIHVGLAVFALLKVTSILFKVELSNHLSFFVFLGTIVCYNFIKYGVEAGKYILVNNRYHKSIQIFSLVAFVFGCYHGYFLSIDSWLIILILTGLTGLYALPVLPQSNNLRSLGGLKIFLVAIVWSGITVVLPYTEISRILVWNDWVEVVQRLLLVLVLMIPFEIRDLAYDKPELKTIPQRIGVTKTKIFGSFLVLFFFFLTFLKDDISELELIAKAVLFLILGGLMIITKRDQTRYFASFWVEFVPIFWWFLIWGLTFYY